MKYGVDESIWAMILNICTAFPEVKSVILYGSRAREDAKLGSDIDLAIDAPSMSPKAFAELWNKLDDLPQLYTLDVIHLQSIQNDTLLKAIKQDGVVL